MHFSIGYDILFLLQAIQSLFLPSTSPELVVLLFGSFSFSRLESVIITVCGESLVFLGRPGPFFARFVGG